MTIGAAIASVTEEVWPMAFSSSNGLRHLPADPASGNVPG